ncbi:polyprenyl synthetase family protein [Halodesulfurarchaeum formicicum]|uniref:Geranylgeranyl diphosphate synthase, type I n=1 Tax=Halodesulfurarchaeum formicicum TaxID=1873524 RepID=A0A1J1ACS3_9EURY|nr:polyprenyl synthetase family protein [Halodesulfurarchaeum formicicum]APE95519.1 geranylgeranyl diphosphate synthase, type I [Halodesulfurarchaeum formicicum]
MRDALTEWREPIDREIEQLLPRTITEETLADLFGPPRYEYDTEAIAQALFEPVWDLLDRGGKRWRPVLFLELVDALGEDPEQYLPYATIPEILHTGTIIVDDVEDDATLRRGEEAIHLRYGTDIALNAGNALYFVPLKVISANPGDLDPSQQLGIYEMLTFELNRTHLGQGTDIVWHNESEIDITEAQYLEMSACKTGCLGRIAGRLAALVTDSSDAVEDAFAAYAESLSIAFQIGDDVLDVKHSLDQAGEFGKAFGNDIREGKRTLLVIHALKKADPADRDRLESILTAEEVTDEEIEFVLSILQETDSVEFALETAERLAADARSQLGEVDIDPEVQAELEDFTRYVIERDR